MDHATMACTSKSDGFRCQTQPYSARTLGFAGIMRRRLSPPGPSLAPPVVLLIWTCLLLLLRALGTEAGHSFASSSLSPAPPVPVDLGTTLVALKFRGGVVVAADSRTSISGYVSHRCADKVVPVPAADCLLARSGSAADTQHLAALAERLLRDRRLRHGLRAGAPQVARLLATALAASAAPLAASLLIAGYDRDRGGGRIFTLAPSGALLEEPVVAVAGSGSTYIMGYLDTATAAAAKWADNELPDEGAAIRICRQALQLAVARDAASGGAIRIFVCSDQGIREETG